MSHGLVIIGEGQSKLQAAFQERGDSISFPGNKKQIKSSWVHSFPFMKKRKHISQQGYS
jgi:hypothetical protein